jgi:NitT/TauT family transport system ATP-binding protein
MTIQELESSPLPAGLRSAAPPPVRARGRLVLSDISKNFANSNAPALRDVSVSTEPGEFVVVVGPSGCGKSTLLNVAAGMIAPDVGAATLDGKPIRAPGPERAMVFQDHGLFPWLTALQNVEFGLRMAGVGRAERRERAAAALANVFLPGSANKLVHELSGGERQRVAIARALVMDPAVLLMDEPFAALDAQTRTQLHEQLQDLWCRSRKTILFVTHSVGEAVRLADRIIVMHAHPGRVRREILVPLSHPRNFDSKQITELVHLVRTEIEQEVKRVNAALAQEQLATDYWDPATAADLGSDSGELGGGI